MTSLTHRFLDLGATLSEGVLDRCSDLGPGRLVVLQAWRHVKAELLEDILATRVKIGKDLGTKLRTKRISVVPSPL